VVYASLIACIFLPLGMTVGEAGPLQDAVGIASYVGKLAVLGVLLAVFETAIAKMRVFRVPNFLGIALMLSLLGTLLLFVSRSL
jgi:formate hydrogenlyase subunit 4